MEKKWTLTFPIHFRDVDSSKKLTMNALVEYMQEIANQHANHLGLDFSEDADKQDYYWIVSRAKMAITHYPKWGESITITTYPDGIDKLFAVRKFQITDAMGQEIGTIVGYYILMEKVTNRPVRLRNLEGNLSLLEEPYEGEFLGKLASPQSIHKIEERKVRFSEIDVNNHMNNAHYIRWTMDMFTTEELQEKEIASLQTNYITSLTEGTVAKVTRGQKQNNKVIVQGSSLEGDIIYWTSEVVFTSNKALSL